MVELVLMRHGESLWNRENRFTGAVDVPLTEAGRRAAAAAGRRLDGLKIGVAYTSTLSRARETAALFLAELGCPAPVIADPALVEKSYGILQGLNKAEVKAEYGEKMYNLWHRSYDVAPPAGESLKDLEARTHPFYRQIVVNDLRLGKNVLLVAHGNVLRSLVMLIEGLDPAGIEEVEIATAAPILYQFDAQLKLLSKKR